MEGTWKLSRSWLGSPSGRLERLPRKSGSLLNSFLSHALLPDGRFRPAGKGAVAEFCWCENRLKRLPCCGRQPPAPVRPQRACARRPRRCACVNASPGVSSRRPVLSETFGNWFHNRRAPVYSGNVSPWKINRVCIFSSLLVLLQVREWGGGSSAGGLPYSPLKRGILSDRSKAGGGTWSSFMSLPSD